MIQKFKKQVDSQVSNPPTTTFLSLQNLTGDFPGGAVVKNLPANAGDTGLIPGPGRSHMPWSN